jgi:hypothetical protein
MDDLSRRRSCQRSNTPSIILGLRKDAASRSALSTPDGQIDQVPAHTVETPVAL